MKKIISIILTVTFLFLVGCSKDDVSTNPEQSQSTTLIPLAINNEWTYEESDGVNVVNYVNKLISSENVSGRIVYRFDITHPKVGMVQDGNWFLLGEFTSTEWDVDVKFKYPDVQIDDQWEQDGIHYKLYNKDVSISTAAGTYKCFEYQATDSARNTLQKSFVSPPIGIIRDETYSLNNVTKITSYSSLISYSLK